MTNQCDVFPIWIVLSYACVCLKDLVLPFVMVMYVLKNIQQLPCFYVYNDCSISLWFTCRNFLFGKCMFLPENALQHSGCGSTHQVLFLRKKILSTFLVSFWVGPTCQIRRDRPGRGRHFCTVWARYEGCQTMHIFGVGLVCVFAWHFLSGLSARTYKGEGVSGWWCSKHLKGITRWLCKDPSTRGNIGWVLKWRTHLFASKTLLIIHLIYIYFPMLLFCCALHSDTSPTYL